MLSYLIKQSDAGTYNATACVGLQFENGNTHDYVLIERKNTFDMSISMTVIMTRRYL